MKILITGASGFIGSFIVEEALAHGFETWAAVRPTSSRRYLQDSRIHFINLDFSSEAKLIESLRSHTFDYVVHAAGVRFVYLSSLSVFGAIREQQPYQEITETDQPCPNTAYGRSKLEAEQFLDSVASRLPFVVLRPTGVYGPREKDYFLMVKSISQHADFSVGFKRQDITFVYVADVVQAVFLALDHGGNGRKYFLSDGAVYQSSTFSRLIREALGRPWWIRITAPIWMLRVVTAVGDRWMHLTGKMTALNNDKYNILRQRNWRCDITPAVNELGYHPQYPLERGVALTVKWYKENNWI